MIVFRRTSIMESSAQTLVNTVNCVGVMGKGLAKAFKLRDPAMFEAYRGICSRDLLQPGKLWLWQGADGWILNFPTKVHWRNPSRLEWIEAGLQKFVAEYASRGITEISFPRLGCGNGGLDWEDVQPLMIHYLNDLDIPVFIHDHTIDVGPPEHLDTTTRSSGHNVSEVSTFEEFLVALQHTIQSREGAFAELGSNRVFHARLNSEQDLEIKLEGVRLVICRDDLRLVWLSLLDGLITQENVGRTMSEAGAPLLALLGTMPQFRTIEVQSLAREPELAVEFRWPSARSTLVPAET